MPFTAQSAIDLARLDLNDAAKVRYPDADLLRALNAFLDSVSLVRPDLFTIQHAALPTTPDTVQQDVIDQDALAIYDVYAVTGGAAITECDHETLSRAVPGWASEPSGTPYHWMRHPSDPAKRDATKYLLYPRPLTGITLVAQAAYAPVDLLIGGTVPLPNSYIDVAAHYIVYKAESRDDEHVLSGRASVALGFVERALGVSLQSKVVIKEGRPG